MKTYKLNWTRQDYGYILIKANNENDALEKFRQGNYKDIDMEIKGGNTIDDGVELLDNL